MGAVLAGVTGWRDALMEAVDPLDGWVLGMTKMLIAKGLGDMPMGFGNELVVLD